jgi:hypothetical protein
VNCADAIPEMGTGAAICVFANTRAYVEIRGAFLKTEQRYLRILGNFYINNQLLYASISTIYITDAFPTVLTDMRGIGRECGFERSACAIILGRSICIFRVI